MDSLFILRFTVTMQKYTYTSSGKKVILQMFAVYSWHYCCKQIVTISYQL